MLYALDLIGTFVFAVSGGLKAVRHDLDVLGILVLAILTGVGGGLVRDVLLGDTPPAVFQDEFFLVACVLGGIVVFFGAPHVAPRWQRMLMADAIGLGVFAAIGAAKATAFGLGPIGVVMMAGPTASGGGVLRDVLVREVPAVISKDFYATAALLGGLAFWLLSFTPIPDGVQLLLAAGVTTGLRVFAIARNMHLPRART